MLVGERDAAIRVFGNDPAYRMRPAAMLRISMWRLGTTIRFCRRLRRRLSANGTQRSDTPRGLEGTGDPSLGIRLRARFAGAFFCSDTYIAEEDTRVLRVRRRDFSATREAGSVVSLTVSNST